MDDEFEYVIIYDNSGGLTKNQCKTQRDQIGELLSSFKNDDNDNDDSNTNPRVAFVEIKGVGCQLLVTLDDNLNNDINSYINFIKNRDCEDGEGQTDLGCGYQVALNEFKRNGKINSIKKIITISNCEGLS